MAYDYNRAANACAPKETPAEINKEFMKRGVYIIISEASAAIKTGSSIFAFGAKIDVEKCFASSNPDLAADNAEDIKLIYGFVLDPKDLPMTLDSKIMKNRNLWVLVDEGYKNVLLEECSDLEEVTRTIEIAMGTEDLDIEDVCVILGEEIGLVLAPEKSGESLTLWQVYGLCI